MTNTETPRPGHYFATATMHVEYLLEGDRYADCLSKGPVDYVVPETPFIYRVEFVDGTAVRHYGDNMNVRVVREVPFGM